MNRSKLHTRKIRFVLFLTIVGGYMTFHAGTARSSKSSVASDSTSSHAKHRGKSLTAIEIERNHESLTCQAGVTVLTSHPVDVGIDGNEFVVSWNAETPLGSGLKVEVRAMYPDRCTRYYTLGIWSKDGTAFPRQSVKDQKDTDGEVLTDTLSLARPARKVQVRLTLIGGTEADSGVKLKFLTVSAADTISAVDALESNRSAWGREIAVPGRSQLGWADAAGWCSPTSTDMVLALWSKRLSRPELDIPVPEAAHAIFDSVFNGTGNWPFNTAFAGSFAGMRAYVSRFSDICELEDWIVAGIPPIVSVSYDLLKGKDTDTDPGHLLVCDGFTPEGDIILNDPAYHPERSEVCRRVFSRANFIRAWARSRFTVYLIYPDGSKLPVDRFGHWAK